MTNIYPETLERLIYALSGLPGVGKRSAERMALALLEWDSERQRDLGEIIAVLNDRITECTTCGNFAESETCRICADPTRDHTLVCVVENARQIPIINKCGRYIGVFHVLGGRLSPLDNICHSDLNIDALFRRISERHVKEVIISTSPDVEGEATAVYLANELARAFDLEVTRIALGVPLGVDLAFADAATMAMAIESRRPMKRT